MAARQAVRHVPLQVQRLGGVVIHQKPTRPGARSQGLEDGLDRPVPAGVRDRLPELEPLAQADEGLPDPVVMLGADPPDDLVLVDMAVNEFRGQLGFADAAHARYHLHGRRSPVVGGKVRAQRLQLGYPADEVEVTVRNFIRPDPLRPSTGSAV